eukprot:Lithocolla_globosa_v1_NODE_2176_length_2126_cov_3.893720.p2 type:complete len:179 gc:universal NODE_2176_length_2126_cov_3.893720:123-659(+)
MVAFLWVYFTQIFVSTVLSTIFPVFVLLMGIPGRPIRPKVFWIFIVNYCMIYMMIVFFFNFPFEFNAISCVDGVPFPSYQPSWFGELGIQHTCLPEGVSLGPTTTLLFLSLFYRLVLLEFGLWTTKEKLAKLKQKQVLFCCCLLLFVVVCCCCCCCFCLLQHVVVVCVVCLRRCYKLS